MLTDLYSKYPEVIVTGLMESRSCERFSCKGSPQVLVSWIGPRSYATELARPHWIWTPAYSSRHRCSEAKVENVGWSMGTALSTSEIRTLQEFKTNVGNFLPQSLNARKHQQKKILPCCSNSSGHDIHWGNQWRPWQQAVVESKHSVRVIGWNIIQQLEHFQVCM